MSSSRSPGFDDGRPAGKPDDRPRARIPTGWEHSPHSADQFVLRCTDCGILDRVDDRADAHGRADAHALDCDHSVGVTPIAQVGVEVPEEGDLVTVTYRSRQSGNELEASGPVVNFERVEGGCEVTFKQSTSSYDRLVIARYDPTNPDRCCRTRSQPGVETVTLGETVDVEYQPVMTDGGRDVGPLGWPPERDEPEPTGGCSGLECDGPADLVSPEHGLLCEACARQLVVHDRGDDSRVLCDGSGEEYLFRVYCELCEEYSPWFGSDSAAYTWKTSHCPEEHPDNPCAERQCIVQRYREDEIDEEGNVVLADGGSSRFGQRSLDDARWDDRQQTLDDLEDDGGDEHA